MELNSHFPKHRHRVACFLSVIKTVYGHPQIPDDITDDTEGEEPAVVEPSNHSSEAGDGLGEMNQEEK
ncbi:hypothetical protein L917_10493 [Phytophthora nicotianae]|uniref:Uncharacterized protein n=2 Tax=Phytophthora nicotianae TaxID=4792 RepID=V9EYG2_PHYNI|nr:hypothetical protein F443_10969 [Phytophthora nicotianae P1569]ETL90916.1 hypothetical protein L917_10493 [Phytophthora nicotianae]ETM44210.1 hypothetical protein L914_10536 [Phytophthora nicotianae]